MLQVSRMARRDRALPPPAPKRSKGAFMFKTLAFSAGAAFLAFTAPVAVLLAQETTGSIIGVVRDASGAVVPEAAVLIRNTRTGAERRVPSGDNGDYVVTALPIGTYEVTVEKTGFKKGSASGIQLSVDSRIRVDFTLEVGSVVETASVSATVSQLDTDSATISGLVDSRRVIDLPLNGRNFAQLINLQAGVSTGNTSNQGSGQFINGARGATNNFLLDGGDLNDPVVPNGSAASVTGAFTGTAPGINAVSVDAVEEFRVITSGASAEFGRNSGAQINVITKSGTNEVHGTLFEFVRNRAFDARSFFDLNPAFQKDGKAIAPPFSQNNFGGTLGGPVKKDKLFYFGSYEGFRQRQGVSVVNNIPSPNTIAAIRQQNRALGEIFASVFTPPFAVNPANELPVAEIIRRNSPVIAPLSLNRSNSFDQNAATGKADYNFSAGSRLSGRYSFFNNSAGAGTVAGSGLPGTGVGFTNRVHNAVVSHTQSFSATKLNEFRATFQRNGVNNTFAPAPSALLDAGRLRTGAFAGQPYGDPFTPNGIPTINSGFGLPELGYTVTSPNIRFSNTYQLSDSFSMTRGRMTIKIGGEIRRLQDNSTFSFLVRPNAQYASAGAFTIFQPDAPMNFFTQNLYLTPATSLRGFRITEWAPYIQTTTRLGRNLTIEAGLRYEYLGRASEVNGFLSNAFLAPNGRPIEGASLISNGIAGLNQVRLIPIGKGRDLGLFRADRNNWAPRIGAAWTLGSTTLRASYGLYYDRIFDNVLGNARNSPPYVVVVTTGGIPFGNSVSNPDPFTTDVPIGPTTVNPDLRFPTTQRWNASIQRQVEKNTVVEVAYVGAAARNLVRTIQPNFGGGFPAAFRPANVDVPRQPAVAADNFRPPLLATFSTRDSTASSRYDALQATVKRRFAQGLSFQLSYTWAHAIDDGSGEIVTGAPLSSVTNLLPVRAANGTIPLPSLANVNAARAAQGLPALATEADAARYFVQNYVGGPQYAAERGNADFDLRHAAILNFIYELPFGKGKAFGSGAPPALRWIVEGWQTNGILRFQTGQPFTLLAGADVNGNGVVNDRASLLSGDLKNVLNPSFGQNGSRQYLVNNSGAVLGFSRTPEDVGSMLSRNLLFAPGLVNVDFSLFKNIPLRFREGMRLQFRAEAFNLLNHTNFGSPNGQITSPAFGLIQSTTVPGRQIQFGLKLVF